MFTFTELEMMAEWEVCYALTRRARSLTFQCEHSPLAAHRLWNIRCKASGIVQSLFRKAVFPDLSFDCRHNILRTEHEDDLRVRSVSVYDVEYSIEPNSGLQRGRTYFAVWAVKLKRTVIVRWRG